MYRNRNAHVSESEMPGWVGWGGGRFRVSGVQFWTQIWLQIARIPVNYRKITVSISSSAKGGFCSGASASMALWMASLHALTLSTNFAVADSLSKDLFEAKSTISFLLYAVLAENSGNYYHFLPISVDILSNSIFDEFWFTCIEKIGFGICGMAAKHVADQWEHVLRPSDFSKHWKLTFRPPNFNFGYDNLSSKPPFLSRSLSGDLLILEYWLSIIDYRLSIIDYRLSIIDYDWWLLIID